MVARKCSNQHESITLPLMVIFKNLSKAPKDIFLKEIVIKSTKGGTMKRGIMKSCYGPELSKKNARVFFSSRLNLL